MNHGSLRRHFPPLQNRISASRRRYCSIISLRNANARRGAALQLFNEAVCAPRQRATVTRVTLVGTVFQFHSNFMGRRDSGLQSHAESRRYVHTCIRASMQLRFYAHRNNAGYLRHIHDTRYIRRGICVFTSEEARTGYYLHIEVTATCVRATRIFFSIYARLYIYI